MKLWRHRNNIDVYEKFVSRCFFRSINKLKQIPLMKKKFGQNLSQIGALYDFYGQKNLGRQSSGIELNSQQSTRRNSRSIKFSQSFGKIV